MLQPITTYARKSTFNARTPTMQSLARNRTLQPECEPIRQTTTLRLDSEEVHGPVTFLNPTRARFMQIQPAIPEDDVPSPDPPLPIAVQLDSRGLSYRPTGCKTPQPTLTYQWTSRSSRKGRHTLLINENEIRNTATVVPQPTTDLRQILPNTGRMFTSFPIGDITFDVAFIYLIGSAIWVLNGFFTLLPYTNPASKFPGEILYGGGMTSFLGIIVFEIGGVLSLFEAINDNRTSCFG